MIAMTHPRPLPIPQKSGTRRGDCCVLCNEALHGPEKDIQFCTECSTDIDQPINPKSTENIEKRRQYEV